MKFNGLHGVLLLVACLLIVHKAAASRKACPYRRGCGASVRLSAAAVCRQFVDTESSCRSCHCQAPSSLYCRRLCVFREQIARCAREFLCPATTTAMTATSTTTTALGTFSTTTATPITTPMSCGTLGGVCVTECPDGARDDTGVMDCPDAEICCLSRPQN